MTQISEGLWSLRRVFRIERVFAGWSREQLLEVGPGRRNLIWALEKLCFWQDTFHIAAPLLLAFAAAENESWGNNATNQFLQLFHVFLSGTQAPPDLQLTVVDVALSGGNDEQKNLAVKALGAALRNGQFTRTGGVESQGSRSPQTDWRPKQWSEVFNYWQECLNSYGFLKLKLQIFLVWKEALLQST